MPAEFRTARRKSAKKRFLAAFEEYGILGHACAIAQVPRPNVYYWQEHDDAFARDYHIALERSTEKLEQEAIRRARDGHTHEKTSYDGDGELVSRVVEQEYSDGLLQFMLKARRPGVYKERVQIDIPILIKSVAGVDVDAI